MVATFAKGIKDLGLDAVAVVEHQPRVNQPNRLNQIRDRLNAGGGAAPWRSDESRIEYENPNNPFSGLQLAMLWNSQKVTIDPNADQLLTQLRQPRNDQGALINRRTRAPWLVPITAGSLQFDMVVLHLKSGGAFPQADEVSALQGWITNRLTANNPRHLIVLGDWNIRPDQSGGRFRLRRLMAPHNGTNLMRVLTVEDIPPFMDGWDQIRTTMPFGGPLARSVPFTHFNLRSNDTFLDHIAISRTMAEVYDHPIRVELASGGHDLRPGIRIAVPLIPERDYHLLTDHLPVILTLRTAAADTVPVPGPAGLHIVAALPNPHGNDRQLEEVQVRNGGTQAVPLEGWRITDSGGTLFWALTTAIDGTVPPGQTVTVVRRGRAMSLNNTGDTVVLMNPQGQQVDSKSYGSAASGQVFRFN